MKSFFAAILAVATVIAGSGAVPQGTACTAVCRTVKPVCPPGQAAGGSAGCWGCCQQVVPFPSITPTGPTVCTLQCRPVKPTCPVGQVAGGSEGCWGCCQPAPEARPCLAVCRPEPPVCPVGEGPSGSEGCWGCCQPGI